MFKFMRGKDYNSTNLEKAKLEAKIKKELKEGSKKVKPPKFFRQIVRWFLK